MKTIKLISKILRACYYTLFISGIFLAYGTVGSLETEKFTITQFWLYELLAIGLIVVAFIVYIVRGEFNDRHSKYLNK